MSERNHKLELYEFGLFRMDLAERVLTKGQQVIPLTPKAFETLVVLVRNSGRVVEKDELLKEVWPNTFVEEGVLAVNVAAIRKALSDGDEGRSYIETLPRRGYRFVGEVRMPAKPSVGEDVFHKPARRKVSMLWVMLGVGLTVSLAAAGGWFFLRSHQTPTESASQPIPLTSYPGAELSPTFSPDGSQVAFSWNGPQQDNFDIYVKLVDRGDLPRRLTQNPDPDVSPAWSPDGRQIAFIRLGSVFLISPLGGHERRLADVQAAYVAWTPDSKSLAVSSADLNYRILLISAEAGESRPLITPLPKGFSVGDIGLAISPDGLKLAFARFTTCCTADLFLAPMAGGEPRRLTENGAAAWGITWTPDGQELIYSSGPFNTAATLWRRRIDAPVSARSQRIDGVEESSVEPVIASHMQRPPWRMAYQKIMLDTNIWSGGLGGLPNGRRVIASTRRDADPQFSPDAQRLAFSSDRSGIRQIWVANSDGSDEVQLTSFTKGWANAPRWSPDGQRIAFAALINNNRDVYLISADGGGLRRLTTELTEEGRPSWSRDGRWIYFYSTRSGFMDIFRMPAEGGAAEQVTTGGGHECFESPDGKLLYYQVGYSGLRSIATGQARPTQGPVFLPTLWYSWWAVAEKGIYFVEFNENNSSIRGPLLFTRWVAESFKVSHPIQFYDFETRKVTQTGLIAKELEQPVPGLSVTSDGQRIAWSQIDHAESDLMMIENFR